MTATLPASQQRQELVELLLVYLIRGLSWPGSDGLTVEEVLASYPAALRNRRVPGKGELLANHPEWATALDDFFADLEATAATPA